MLQRSPNQKPRDSENQQEEKQPRQSQRWSAYFWLMVMGILVLSWFIPNRLLGQSTIPTIDYSTFRSELRASNIARVTIQEDEIRGEFVEPIRLETAVVASSNQDASTDEAEPPPVEQFITYLPAFGDDNLLSLLEAEEVPLAVEPAPNNTFWSLIISFLPFLLIIGFFYFFYLRAQQRGQNLLSFGGNRAKQYEQEQVSDTFDDVAGVEGAKTELREIIEYLKEPERVQRLGGEAPKGILLVGPPGTGKTLLARAVAGEAEVPFFSMSGSDFMEMFVGVGASRVRGLFKEARQVAPCIIFIDELDSIGRRRGAGLGGSHDEREQTLNQLLSEMDGFDPSENVVVIAATNRPDILDPALQRPGRFDRRVTVDLPTLKAREEILAIHAQGKPLADDVELEKVARGTPGFSGADLKNILNEAALLAARYSKVLIEWSDIEEARDKILMGLEREGMVLTEKERRLLAYHEGGHALLAAVLPHADPIHKVTIVPRGQAMGVTQQLPEKEKYIYPQEYLLDRLVVMMGGRAAEALIFNTATSGAENDLKQATQLARRMVLDWGMSSKLSHMALGGRQQQVFLGDEIAHKREYSEETAYAVDEEIKRILREAYELARETLDEKRAGLDKIAAALLEEEEIPGDLVLALLDISKEANHESSRQVENGRVHKIAH